jgi:transketolase
MALAARMLADRFNSGDAFRPVTHRVFVLASDGDLMEGVSAEASSAAGHLGLGNLVVLYDDNRITIEGSTDLAFTEDVLQRYRGYGWQTLSADGHDHEAIGNAIREAVAETGRPSLVRLRTHIGYGAPSKQDTAGVHGSPLGDDERAAAKKNLGWPLTPTFLVPEKVRELFAGVAERGTASRATWEAGLSAWRQEDPDRAAAWEAHCSRTVPEDIVDRLLATAPEGDGATRAHGGKVLQEVAALVPALAGGSADLSPSNKSVINGSPSVLPGDFSGRNLHFGIREHAMGAMMNGMLYHGSFRPYGATFLVFSDYMRPAIRVAALSGIPAIYIFTHDSIFVGEDGPTHEPIEHAAALRLIPGVHVYRPADGLETALAWGHAIERTDGPTCLLLSRQGLPAIDRMNGADDPNLKRGAYKVMGEGTPDAVVAATGSELHLAVAAARTLAEDGRSIHVVSIPCLERFEEQDPAYREELFPPGVPVATVEAGRTAPWKALCGLNGLAIGIDRFGASAPAAVLAEEYGMTAAAVTARLRSWLGS